MAKVVTPRGLGTPFALRPAERQSRVVALELHAPAGVGNSDFCYTSKLGNRLLLYTIDVWAYCSQPGALYGGFFYITFGTGEPKSGEDVAVRWTTIVPLYCGLKPGFRWFTCGELHRCFTMARLFTANEIRFGAVIENGFNQTWETTIAFEISEG